MTGKEVLSLLGALLILLLVLAGCYLFTRWAGTGLAGRDFGPVGRRRQIKVLERLTVGKDQSLLVIELAGRYFLLGCSPSGISLLCELTEEEGALWAAPPAGEGGERMPPDFREMLRKLREKK
ncbi:MAG: flagellar biosynthetic protein FliO [Oscillospiraceae bacterium]|nr:flagellar biosynthetic protein FliO [Oscillospiraceae bacterium]